ncbi:ABC transporter ATP-binding protein [Aestuariivivens sediminis]|uniref:ABC transporter ATP-binding protein n=1 Tax=Aestuariivivens sediminis TaxID=2913557 RepID=UPI001F566546|nr:ABC transporter ATP-binding protein [Aestuariivivens sediminis]
MILSSEHISKSFGGKKVLTDISFELHAGTITGIVGENGSGKSVLMEILVGVRKPNKGKINSNGRLGYCPQNALLFPHLTVQEHFKYFSTAYGIDVEHSNTVSEELLNHFNFDKYKHEIIKHLSGGTKQKLNLSIALLNQPDLLILDEPYNGFDWDTYQKFWNYTDQLKKQGCAILIVSHLISDKEKLDHIYKLENGILI